MCGRFSICILAGSPGVSHPRSVGRHFLHQFFSTVHNCGRAERHDFIQTDLFVGDDTFDASCLIA